MRVVLQRVSYGAVRVEGGIVGAIERGFVILVGVGHTDGDDQAQWLARKIAGLRVFEDDDGKFNRSLLDVGGQVLAVSQFTLYGDARKGRRPSFDASAPADLARPLFEKFVSGLSSRGILTAVGRFQAIMHVELVNDGPVTILLESPRA